MLITDFVGEYSRYRSLGGKAMAQVGDEALNRVLAPDGNSIAVIVRHVGGNLASRFTDLLTTDGEKPSRDRDGEFADGPFSRAEVDAAWKRGWDVIEGTLAGLTDADMATIVKIRGNDLTVHEALCRSLAHVSMHVGQIILLARILATSEWKSLSIPRGQSAAYNANPSLDKAHRK